LSEDRNDSYRSRFLRRGRMTSVGRICGVLLVFWSACCGLCQSAVAQVSVSGTPNAVRVETRQASIDEVLNALHNSFKLQYSATGAVGRVISGTFSGSLSSVVARILDGQNYVVMHGPADTLQVWIVNTNGAAAKPTAAPRPGGPDPVKECKYKGVPIEC